MNKPDLKEHLEFESPEEFEKARAEIIKEVSNNGN